jgi:hypothetical protein
MPVYGRDCPDFIRTSRITRLMYAGETWEPSGNSREYSVAQTGMVSECEFIKDFKGKTESRETAGNVAGREGAQQLATVGRKSREKLPADHSETQGS